MQQSQAETHWFYTGWEELPLRPPGRESCSPQLLLKSLGWIQQSTDPNLHNLKSILSEL